MTPLQMYLLRSGHEDPRAGVDVSGASVQKNPGFGMNFGTAAQLLGTAGLPTPIGLGIGLFNKVMGPWGIVDAPTAPQIGGHFPGGTQQDLKDYRDKMKALNDISKMANVAESNPTAVALGYSGGFGDPSGETASAPNGGGAFGRDRPSRPGRR